MSRLDSLNFDNTYTRLPTNFYRRVMPTPIKKPHHVHWNTALANSLGIELPVDDLQLLIDASTGNALLPGSDPIAMKYTGHQFGIFNPELGDGRGLLLGEIIDPQQQRWDIHLKGAGQTPYSRQGDGRAVLRSTIREYLCSEAMHGLGIPTTRALNISGSREPVYRERVETAATLLRLAKTHIRFGHFEYFASIRDNNGLEALANYTIDQLFPEYGDARDKHELLLKAAIERTARLIAQWQAIGFCHGVMNTDNMSIAGDTFDYGPFAFLDDFKADYICNHSDYQGRYAFNQQPGIGFWNTRCLASAMAPLIGAKKSEDLLACYEPAFHQQIQKELSAKLGLALHEEQDNLLIRDLLQLLHSQKVDYTIFFRQLCDFHSEDDPGKVRDLFPDRNLFDKWARRYTHRLLRENIAADARQQAMRTKNPLYILRNYMLQQAIDEAEKGDFAMIDTLLTMVRSPFTGQEEMERYAGFPPDWGKHMEISCSS